MSGTLAEGSAGSDLSRLLQTSRRVAFFTQPVKEGWITVYESWRNEQENGAIYSALVPGASVAASLEDASWDLGIGRAGPRCSVSNGPEQEEVVEYSRLGGRAGVEPLVLIRVFHGIRPDSVELLEEFRLFHNLYHDRRTDCLLKFDDAGNANEVVRIETRSVRVSALELRQFLAIKDMSLVLQIDSVSSSEIPLTAVPEEERDQEFHDVDRCWQFGVRDARTFGSEHRSFSRLLGKCVITGVEKSESGFWPYGEREDDTYPEFIIGSDQNGAPMRSTCDPDELANYFGANPDAPHYLTPVYFRREVLQRYYSNPTLYRVEDGAVRCAGLWMLRIDNHLSEVVSAYLGDLGRDLPASERGHWTPFNVQSDAGVSKTKRLRDFYVEFADPERPDLLFKHRFEQFQHEWRKKYGWTLFLAPAAGDEHLFSTLREPLNDDQGEFDSQILALTKTVIDSLNEERLASSLAGAPAGVKGIEKLKLYLSQASVRDAPKAIAFLRLLQSLRSSGVGHRKGRKYERAAGEARLNELGRRAAFREILTRAREDVLEVIGDHFLEADWR